MYAPPEEKYPEQRVFSMVLYVFAALAAISQYAESLAMNIAGFAILICVGFMLKAQKLTAKGTIYESHVKWIERTMSITTYFFFPVAITVILYLVYKSTDLEAPKRALQAAEGKDVAVMMGIVEYIANNQSTIDTIFTCCITPPVLWWVRRCWYGYARAKRSEPIDFPDSLI